MEQSPPPRNPESYIPEKQVVDYVKEYMRRWESDLHADERELWKTIPREHREMLALSLKHSGILDVVGISKDRVILHFEEIRGSLFMILDNDPASRRLWGRYLGIRRTIGNCFKIRNLTELVYPLSTFDDRRENLEFRLEYENKKDEIDLNQLSEINKKLKLGLQGIFALLVWSMYRENRNAELFTESQSNINAEDRVQAIDLVNQAECAWKSAGSGKEDADNGLDKKESIPLSLFVDANTKYADLIRDADKAYLEKYKKQHTAKSLFVNLPVLCPHLVDGLEGKGEQARLIIKGDIPLTWRQFRIRHYKTHFPQSE